MQTEHWERFRDKIQSRLNYDNPPFRNIVIELEGEGLVEIVEVPDGASDGVLNLLIGDESVTATYTWTILTRD